MSGVFSLAFNPITYQWDPRKKSANVRLSDLNSSAKFLTDLNTTMCLGNKRYILGVDSDEWEISIYNDGLVNIIIGVATDNISLNNITDSGIYYVIVPLVDSGVIMVNLKSDGYLYVQSQRTTHKIPYNAGTGTNITYVRPMVGSIDNDNGFTVNLTKATYFSIVQTDTRTTFSNNFGRVLKNNKTPFIFDTDVIDMSRVNSILVNKLTTLDNQKLSIVNAEEEGIIINPGSDGVEVTNFINTPALGSVSGIPLAVTSPVEIVLANPNKVYTTFAIPPLAPTSEIYFNSTANRHEIYREEKWVSISTLQVPPAGDGIALSIPEGKTFLNELNVKKINILEDITLSDISIENIEIKQSFTSLGTASFANDIIVDGVSILDRIDSASNSHLTPNFDATRDLIRLILNHVQRKDSDTKFIKNLLTLFENLET